MVLGESHYCNDKCENCGDLSITKCKEFTTEVIHRLLKYKEGKAEFETWMNTFIRFTNVIIGKQTNYLVFKDFWNSILFYNYIQKTMSGPRISPTEQDFKKYFDAFLETVNEYKPDLIIVWGKRLWNNLPKKGEWGDKILDGANGKFFYYIIDGEKIPSYGIYHPSSSTFGYIFNSYLKEAVHLAGV
ncbi:MAG: uracil-DNA glycosylase [Bacteroidota bacterium]|nr:uracil-DNA glycosylase [Bacteroidota bacterium]